MLLCHVAVLAIERERAIALSVDAVVDAFAVAHKNRRIALYTVSQLPFSCPVISFVYCRPVT